MTTEQAAEAREVCRQRGYHRIPALELVCIECEEELSAADVILNEWAKIRLTGVGRAQADGRP